MRLILMRHAKSDWSLVGDDHSRPLNPRGERSAKALGDWLRSGGHVPEMVLCSTATRTRQTLDLLALPKQVVRRFERGLYHAAPETMLDTLKSASGDCVLMIGHNPGIAYLADMLVDVAPDTSRFEQYPTGATLIAEWPGTDWSSVRTGSGTVVDFIVPRDLI